MKKILAVVLTFTLLLTCLCVNGIAETQGDFEYTVKDGEAIVTEYVGSATDVTIPSTLGGVPVTTIAGFAFYSTEGAGVPSTAVSLHIPESVTTLEYGALYGCNEVTAYTVSSENSSFKVVDGVLFSKDGKTLVRYPAGRTDTSYTIPAGVTAVEHYAFANGKNLTSVGIPDSVTVIKDRGFYSCTALACVEFPKGLTTIGDAAFFFCKNLTSLNIPSSVVTIGESAFNTCVALESVTIGRDTTAEEGSRTVIGKSAFTGCNNLVEVTIGSGVSVIGQSAFYWCSNLTTLNFEEGVTTIGKSAFSSCRSLALVTFPNSVTAIGDAAFYFCDSLTAVTIPESVATIGKHAFAYVTDGCVTPAPMEGFVIKGAVGSAAEVYALNEGIIFEAVTKRGDLNHDEKVDDKDALEVLNATVGKVELTTEQKAVADMDEDGAINAKDALLILRKAVGK